LQLILVSTKFIFGEKFFRRSWNLPVFFTRIYIHFSSLSSHQNMGSDHRSLLTALLQSNTFFFLLSLLGIPIAVFVSSSSYIKCVVKRFIRIQLFKRVIYPFYIAMAKQERTRKTKINSSDHLFLQDDATITI